jgi:hypothetical protein
VHTSFVFDRPHSSISASLISIVSRATQTMVGGRKKPALPPLLTRFVLAVVVVVLRDHGGALLTGNLTAGPALGF